VPRGAKRDQSERPQFGKTIAITNIVSESDLKQAAMKMHLARQRIHWRLVSRSRPTHSLKSRAPET
jgi:hypothetical protein